MNQLKLSPKGQNGQRFIDTTPVNNTPELLVQNVYPLTAKGSRDQGTLYSQLHDKGRKSQQHQTSSCKENLNKGASIQSTQILLSRTNSPKADDATKGEMIIPNDSVPQSKQSARIDSQKHGTAGALANTLNGIYSPQARKQTPGLVSNKQAVQSFEPTVTSARRNSKTGLKDQNQSRSNPAGRQTELQNFLEGITGADQDVIKGSQRSSLKTGNNSTAGYQRVPSPNTTSQYQEMIKTLSNKNQELDSLGKENAELKATLGSLANELRELKKMKMQMAEKDKLIAQLKSTLGGKSQDSQEIEKDFNIKATLDQFSKNHSVLDQISKEGMDELLSQLNKPNSKEGPRSPDKKLSLLEMLKHHSSNAQGSNPKKPVSSYMLSNLEYRTERNSNPVNAISPGQLYQRNFSTTLETSKRKLESPYYENILGAKREPTRNEFSNNNIQKKQPESRGNIKKPLQMQPSNGGKQTPTNSQSFKKGEISEVLRKSSTGRVGGLQIKNELQFEKSPAITPNTTTGTSVDPTKRKFSHDPKGSCGATNTATPCDSDHTHPTSVRGEKSYRQSSLEKPLDIAAGLNMIKERIKMMLIKHREHHNTLKQTNALILEKLEKLAIDQSSLAA